MPLPKLLDQVRSRLRVTHYSIRTDQAYADWIKRFIWNHGKRHPKYWVMLNCRWAWLFMTPTD